MRRNVRRITEQDLRRVVNASVRRAINEAESYGWVVEASEAQEAYDLAADVMGEETINRAIVKCLGSQQLAECLAYIFRQYDFEEWRSRHGNDPDED